MSRRSRGAPGHVQGRPSAGGDPFIGKPNTKAAVRKNVSNMGVKDGVPSATCPVCELEVPLRKSDGCLRSHRVGANMKQSWPCLGSNSDPNLNERER